MEKSVLNSAKLGKHQDKRRTKPRSVACYPLPKVPPPNGATVAAWLGRCRRPETGWLGFMRRVPGRRRTGTATTAASCAVALP